MAKRTDIQKILIIGAGPIVIGQACEFDYSGTQACRALMAEGYEVILINSNPATIMTDPKMAHRTYIEPITPEVVRQIIEKEKPDAILPTMGGQTALNTAFELHQLGILDYHNVELIGANFKSIEVAEDRDAFKELMDEIGLESLKSTPVESLAEAEAVAQELGFPLILRPAFTLGGSGGAFVYNEEELKEKVLYALDLSPIHQVLMEESAIGWKEYEFEVMRDCRDNVVIVCSVENVDPMGIHTGDSITVAPAQTLTDREYQVLRNASINIIRAVGVDAGGCNIQFAVEPQTGRVIVIEMNPRVSRSSALVSKATGVPIAKIAAKLAVGLTLDEIANDITQHTPACFEPAIDYVVTKVPRFSFAKFPGSDAQLSPQMKSVGEVMAIGRTFQESFQKALRGLEENLDGFDYPVVELSEEDLYYKLTHPSWDRMRWVYQALHQGWSIEKLYETTGIDPWFLDNLADLLVQRNRLEQFTLDTLPSERLAELKAQGFSDAQIGRYLSQKVDKGQLREKRKQHGQSPVYKAVDTCAGEFVAETPYFYSTYDGVENELPPVSEKKRVVILGGGPNRIGQGIEFDYCCVHASMILRELGYESVMVNSNPETVSTDYDISDQLVFDPLYPEDVLNLMEQLQPHGVLVQLGGQTPLKLAKSLVEAGVPILGTTADSIDQAEDRDRFDQILKGLNLRAPESGIARSEEEALDVARRIGYPLIARPSYVLGGRAMRIFYSEESLKSYLADVVQVEPEHPVLIDHFLEGAVELDVDAVSDGETIYIGAILEHIEHAGVHSGDSACVYPALSLSPEMANQVKEATEALAQALSVRGLINIQFAIQNDTLYILEVNPRASRTVPFVSKASGAHVMKMAVRVMLGESLKDVLADEPPPPVPAHFAVKAPVFPFTKFKGADPKLGPEMRSTGEVMGVAPLFPLAYGKAMMGAGMEIPMSGNVFISVNDWDKAHVVPVAKQFQELGFQLLATAGTATLLQRQGLPVRRIKKKHEGSPNAEELIRDHRIQLVINTPIGEEAMMDDSYIRKVSVANQVPIITTMAGASAMAQAIDAFRTNRWSVRSLQELFNTKATSAQAPATLA